jgi:hypothetical protein
MAAAKKSAARKQAAPRKASTAKRPPREPVGDDVNRVGRQLASDGRPVLADGLSLSQWREAHKGDPADVKRETTRYGRPLADDGNPVFAGGLSHAQWKAKRRAERAKAAVARPTPEEGTDA